MGIGRGREGRDRGEVRGIDARGKAIRKKGGDTGLIPKCTHLILMVNLCTPIKQELHIPIMPPT